MLVNIAVAYSRERFVAFIGLVKRLKGKYSPPSKAGQKLFCHRAVNLRMRLNFRFSHGLRLVEHFLDGRSIGLSNF